MWLPLVKKFNTLSPQITLHRHWQSLFLQIPFLIITFDEVAPYGLNLPLPFKVNSCAAIDFYSVVGFPTKDCTVAGDEKAATNTQSLCVYFFKSVVIVITSYFISLEQIMKVLANISFN